MITLFFSFVEICVIWKIVKFWPTCMKINVWRCLILLVSFAKSKLTHELALFCYAFQFDAGLFELVFFEFRGCCLKFVRQMILKLDWKKQNTYFWKKLWLLALTAMYVRIQRLDCRRQCLAFFVMYFVHQINLIYNFLIDLWINFFCFSLLSTSKF